ncbi:hypothetical protein evm_014747 [Chilo suppressalis]|nr:hypothetical protein evm_014747 [Chilo suppressalis]
MVNLTDISEEEAREVRRRWWQSPKKAKTKTPKSPKTKTPKSPKIKTPKSPKIKTPTSPKPASVAAAVGGSRAAFLQRDKLYKQRLKQLAKQHPQPNNKIDCERLVSELGRKPVSQSTRTLPPLENVHLANYRLFVIYH